MTTRLTFNRRSLLRALGGVAAACASPLRAHAAVSDTMQRLSTFMAAAATAPLPEAVVEKTKHMVLDTFAAMISGAGLPPGKFAIQFVKAYKGDRVATVVASNVLCGPIEAALANGMLAHSDETDDTHPPSQSHPAASVVPAALAAGERFDIDGTRFLRAVALGYDVGTRVTATLGRLQYMAQSHHSTHGIAGNFGSAAAAGCAAGLNAQQMRWLLSFAAQEASGLASWQRDSEHVEKAFDFGGMPARNGVTAALLVSAGATGVDDVFSGADSFFDAFVPLNDRAMVADKLGERYEITRTNIKKWTVGAPIQAPLDALEALMKKNGFKASDVQHIDVRVATNEAAIVNNREIPDICLQHLIAVMLIDGTVSFASAHDLARMRDAAVTRERAKVQLVPDAELEKLMPSRVAVVDVTLKDDRRLTSRVEAVRGTAQNPMTRDEVIAKATDLIAPVLGPSTCRALVARVFELEKVRRIVELRPLLQRAS